jgi:hypothetical protein
VVDRGIAEVFGEQLDARLLHQSIDLAAGALVLLRHLRDREGIRGASAWAEAAAFRGVFGQLLQVRQAG